MSDLDNALLLDDDDIDAQANKYLLFNIGSEIFGIAIQNVTEIIELQTITVVPDMPDYVKGVINLRGKVIPVMDLRLRFGLEPREYDDRTCIINVKINATLIGFIVDTVAEVYDVPDGDIEQPPEFQKETGHKKYISGLGKVGDEVKILLDVDKILYDEELLQIREKV